MVGKGGDEGSVRKDGEDVSKQEERQVRAQAWSRVSSTCSGDGKRLGEREDVERHEELVQEKVAKNTVEFVNLKRQNVVEEVQLVEVLGNVFGKCISLKRATHKKRKDTL